MLIGMSRSRKWTLITASLLAIGPLLLILLTAMLAALLGCEVNDAATQACYVFGGDAGPFLSGLFSIGSLGMVIIPILLALAPFWLLVEAVLWWRARRRERRASASADDALIASGN